MPVNPEDMIQLLMKTNADQEECLKEKDQTISDLRATVEELRNTVTDLRSTIANLNETLDEFKRKLFWYFQRKSKAPWICLHRVQTQKKLSWSKNINVPEKRNPYVMICTLCSPSGISNVTYQNRNVFARTVMHLWNTWGTKLSVRN